MKLRVLGSGSEGNATLIHSETTALLIDAGFACRELEKRLKLAGFMPEEIKAIAITHEHTDHIRGAALFSRRYGIPIYLTRGTWLAGSGQLEKAGKMETVIPDEPFAVGDITLHPFSIPHDAAEPVAYLSECRGRRALVMTDLGFVTVRAIENFRLAHLALVESNHDPELLDIGPYPWPLKQRIKGKLGHLSNDDCMRLLADAAGEGLGTVIFAHLSRQNNNPNLVRLGADSFVAAAGQRITYEIARQDQLGALHDV